MTKYNIILVMTLIATAFIATFLMQSVVQALGPTKPIVPEGTLESARKAKRLLATVQVSPNEFTCDGKPFSFKQAWVQRSKNDNHILLCFTLSGFKKKHRFIGFDTDDDLEFGAMDRQYFGCDANWWDGHWVHVLDLLPGQQLPSTVQVVFYGSGQAIHYALNQAPVLERFTFKIQKVAAAK